MAKEEKAATVNPDPKAPAKTKNSGGGASDKFKYLGENKDHKLPPQARQIVDLIKTAGTITREALMAQASKVVVTKQPIGRILSYYQKRLTDNSFVAVTK